jgi:hypothetical protein
MDARDEPQKRRRDASASRTRDIWLRDYCPGPHRVDRPATVYRDLHLSLNRRYRRRPQGPAVNRLVHIDAPLPCDLVERDPLITVPLVARAVHHIGPELIAKVHVRDGRGNVLVTGRIAGTMLRIVVWPSCVRVVATLDTPIWIVGIARIQTREIVVRIAHLCAIFHDAPVSDCSLDE